MKSGKKLFGARALLACALMAIGAAGACNAKGTPEQIAKHTNSLIIAIRDNDMEQAKLCIKEGVNINENYRDEGTPLIYALEKERIELAKIIIKSKPDLSIIGSRKRWTALTLALYYKYFDIVELLLKSGADANKMDGESRCPIILAVVAGRKDIVEMLIKAKADVNIRDDNNDTAIIYAAGWQREDIAELLIKSGADVNAMNNDGETALKLAKSNGNQKIITLLKAAGAR